MAVPINKEVNIEFDINQFSRPHSVDYFNDKDYLLTILPPLQGVHTFTNANIDDLNQFEEDFTPEIDMEEDGGEKTATNKFEGDTTLTAKDDVS